MEASNLFNIPTQYLDDSKFDKTKTVRSVHELAELANIPKDLSGNDKRVELNKHNKVSKVRPPTQTKHAARPDLSDMEIALIVCSYNTIHSNIIARTLNISVRTVEEIYKQYKHEELVQVPLIMITDTSRYLSPDNERFIYNQSDFHHLDDPLTNKELLRQDITKTNKEFSIETISVQRYFDSKIQAGCTLVPPTGSARYITTYKSIEESHTGLYGGTWNKYFGTVCKESILGYEFITPTIDNKLTYSTILRNRFDKQVFYSHMNYHIKHNTTTPTNLAQGYLLSYNNSTNKESIGNNTWVQAQVYLLAPLLYNNSNMIHKFIKDYHLNHTTIETTTLTYTTNSNHYKNYEAQNNHIYTPYHITRPPIYYRGLSSPIQDFNQKLRYTFPNNTYIKFPSTTSKYDTTFPAVYCNKCHTFLSQHTTLSCECKDITIDVKTTSMTKRTSKVKLKHITINPNIPEYLANKVNSLTSSTTSRLKYAHGQTKSLYPNSSKNRQLYRYTSSIKYQHKFYQTTKAVLQIFQTQEANYSIHLYNYSDKLTNRPHNLFNITPDISPLYTSFNFPLPNTTQEPYVT